MVWLFDGEKNLNIARVFVSIESINVTDRQTDRHRATAYAALMHRIAQQKHRPMYRRTSLCHGADFVLPTRGN